VTSETRWNLCVAALILIAMLRIAATYRVFSCTFDEPAHIACGLEWIEGKTYNYEYQHPPLARVMMGLGLYLDGVRAPHRDDFWSDGETIIYSGSNYRNRLTLARMGNLPFLILAAVVVWLWGKRWFNHATGLWAVLLFLSVPAILAHAGLATLDVAAMATCALALYQLVRWREQPTMRRALILSGATALALLCKFSVPAFLVVSGIIGLIGIRRGDCPKLEFSPMLKQAVAFTGVLLLLVWAGYRFRIQPVVEPDESGAVLTNAMTRVLGPRPQLLKAVARVFQVRTPFGGLLRGFAEVLNHDAKGHTSYLLGKTIKTGVWAYFPVLLTVKTPIGFLLLTLGGFGIIFYRFRAGPWQHRVTALFPFGILLVCMNARINIGLRHILPIYPLLALLAGHAAAELSKQWKTRWLAVGLAGWVVIACAMAHPDYLPYFNAIAGSHPEEIVAGSDLDWGQDLDRLSARLRELHADHVGIAYSGGEPLSSAGLPPYTLLKPREVTTGYVAISLHILVPGYAANGDWAWLHDRQPIERVGKSINLYSIGK
jgi:hypothetical protein